VSILDWLAPSACTLPTREKPLRVAEFDQLFSNHLVAIQPQGAFSIRMILHPNNDSSRSTLLGTVQDLVHRESQCCSFFTFYVSSLGQEVDGVALEIGVPSEQLDVLAAIMARADLLLTQSKAGRP
jgi:hypothetical protein